MSSNFRSFLRGLLNKEQDPHSRLTGPKLLDHPFVVETFDDVEARELRANTAASRGCDTAWKGEQHVQTTTLASAPEGKSPSPTIMDHPRGNGQQPVITSPQLESQRVTENDNIQSVHRMLPVFKWSDTHSEPEKQMRHEKHYRYASTHDIGYWARSFLLDLDRTCKDHVRKRCWAIGFGLSFSVVALDPNFRKLSMEHIVSAYKQTRTRAILLDYDGKFLVRKDKILHDPQVPLLKAQVKFLRQGFMMFAAAVQEQVPTLNLSSVMNFMNMEADGLSSIHDNTIDKNPSSASGTSHHQNSQFSAVFS
ncbi:hypothetical protein Tco_1353916 [Tanacetum coccineum]